MTDHDHGRADVPYSPPGEPTQPLQGQTQPITPPPAPPEPPPAPPEPPPAPPEPPPVAAAPPQPAAGRPNPLTAISPGDLPAYAAAALVVAVIALAFGALLVASSVDGSFGDDEWKITVKMIGLNSSFGFGFGFGGSALFAGLALVAAQHLVRGEAASRRTLVAFVGIGTLAVAVWLAFFTVLGIIVDFTYFGDDFVPAFGVLSSDLGALVVLLVAVAWGYQTFRTRD